METTVYTNGSTQVCGIPQGSAHWCFSQTTTISVWSYIYFTLYLWIFHLRVREENPIFHWDLFLPVRRGSEKIPGKKPFVVSSYSNVVLNHPGKDVFSVWLILYRLTDYIVFQAPRAILRRTRQEELQQLQNVPVVPTRLRRGALWGRTGPPDPVFSRRLRHPVAPIQSQHQLCGLLLHHTEAFKQGEQVHRLPRLVGVERKQDAVDIKSSPRWLSVPVGVCVRGVRCVAAWKVADACGYVCVCLYWSCAEWPGLGLPRAAFD